MIRTKGRCERHAVTLLEVLVAIFIMGVGLLAILTLFPLGALSMAQAVREDRAAAIAANVHNIANAFDVSAGGSLLFDLRNDSTVSATLGLTPAADPALTFVAPDPDGPGYPVVLDPTYVSLGSTVLGKVPSTLSSAVPPLALQIVQSDPLVTIWSVTPGLARVSPQFLTARQPQFQSQAIARWFTFQDEITFNASGLPQSETPGTAINRPGTYTWTAAARRFRSVPQGTGSAATGAELSVVVYANRPTDVPGGETIIYTTNTLTPGWVPGLPAVQLGTKGTTTLTFDYSILGGSKPNIRRGSWILDTTYTQKTVVIPPGGSVNFGTVNGYFYRVASVTDNAPNPTGITTAMTLELETPLRADVASFVIMENVITVLDRGTSRRP